MTSFATYADKARHTDRATWIGTICWYTVHETQVKWTDLRDALQANGLQTLCPREPRNEDVFRRLTPNGHRKRVSTSNELIHVNYLIRQVSRGGGSCLKHIVAEYVDTEGETLEFEDVQALRYDGEKDVLATWPLGVGDVTAMEIAADIVREFHVTKGRVDANALRKLIRTCLIEARATTVRSTGGVYFVMSNYVDKVDALESVADVIPGMMVHSLPLQDDKKQRDMLRQAYEAETTEEVDRMLGEIAELLTRENVTPDAYARLSAHFTELTARNQEYIDLLEDTLDNAGSKLSIYRAQMTQLLRKVS